MQSDFIVVSHTWSVQTKNIPIILPIKFYTTLKLSFRRIPCQRDPPRPLDVLIPLTILLPAGDAHEQGTCPAEAAGTTHAALEENKAASVRGVEVATGLADAVYADLAVPAKVQFPARVLWECLLQGSLDMLDEFYPIDVDLRVVYL